MIIIRTKEFGSVLDEKVLLEVSDFGAFLCSY